MTTLMAIYGAVLSTLIAALQIRNFYLSQKFVHVQVKRSLDLKSEYVDFIISNRSNMVTEIREAMIGAFGNGGEIGFHMLWASGVKLYKGVAGEKCREAKLPLALHPGETVVCSYSSREAERDIEYFSEVPVGKKDTLSNLFCLEIEHSRSNNPKEVLFELELRYLDASVVDWTKIVSLKERRSLWPVHRHFK